MYYHKIISAHKVLHPLCGPLAEEQEVKFKALLESCGTKQSRTLNSGRGNKLMEVMLHGYMGVQIQDRGAQMRLQDNIYDFVKI